MNTPHNAQADNITMSGGGLYSLTTKGAKDVIDAATPLLINAIDAMAPPPQLKVFSVADMGCADGGTSLGMLGTVFDHVRRCAPHANLDITYCDQPGNDFNALVKIVHGRSEFDSYTTRLDNVFVRFSAASFYLQGLPDDSLDLGFSATAMHWLSRKPCDIADHIQMVGARGETLDAFANQAKQDWQCILKHRAKELRANGRLVLVNFCRDPEGRYLGNTGGVNMFDNLRQNWLDFVEQGRITQDEYVRMTLPQYYNTVEEFSAPLLDARSECYRLGLRLEDLHTRIVRCPFAAEFAEHGDVDQFADGLTATIRSWNQSIFFGALDAHRPLAERQQVIEDYYARYRQQIHQNPHAHRMDYVHAYITIRKQ